MMVRCPLWFSATRRPFHRVAETLIQQTAGPSNDERIRALQGMDFEAMKAYFADLKG